MANLEYTAYEDLEFNDLEFDSNNSFYQFPCKHQRDDELMYIPGTEEYKKARKRRQNRESAIRIRAKKKMEECKIISTLSVLKENTGKLKIENAKLKSENELLKKQILLCKKLVDPSVVNIKDESQKIVLEKEKNSEKIEDSGKNPVKKGKTIAGLGLAITILCLICFIPFEDSQAVNTGGRSLVFFSQDLDPKPIFISGLLILSAFCIRHLFFQQ